MSSHPQISLLVFRKARDNGARQSIFGRQPGECFSIKTHRTLCCRSEPKVPFSVLICGDYVLSDPVGVRRFKIKSIPNPVRNPFSLQFGWLIGVRRWHDATFHLFDNGRVHASKFREIGPASRIEKINPTHAFVL